MAKDLLITWLNDAYAMEESQVEMLERFIKDFDSEPDIKSRLQEHLDMTRQQREDIKTCLGRLDQTPSKVKSLLGNLLGMAQGMSTGPYKDELIKNMLLLHAGEHFEHASYLALVTAAEECCEDEIADVCERIAEEENDMADWAGESLPDIVSSTMQQIE